MRDVGTGWRLRLTCALWLQEEGGGSDERGRLSAAEEKRAAAVARELGWRGLLGRAAEAVASPPEWAGALLGWRRGKKASGPK